MYIIHNILILLLNWYLQNLIMLILEIILCCTETCRLKHRHKSVCGILLILIFGWTSISIRQSRCGCLSLLASSVCLFFFKASTGKLTRPLSPLFQHTPPTPRSPCHTPHLPMHISHNKDRNLPLEWKDCDRLVEGHLSCCEVMQNMRVGSDQWLDCSGSDEIPSGQQIFLPFSHSSGSYFSVLDNKIHFNLHCPPSICSGWHGPSIGGGAIIFGYEKMQPRVSLFLCSATYIFVWGQPCIFLRQLQPSGKPPTCSCVTSQGSGVITQTASTERALLCRITFINHHAGSFSLTPDSMTYTPTTTPPPLPACSSL